MFDAIVLAGGASRRMRGLDKPTLEVGGISLLERALAAVSDAARTVVVGPARPVTRAVIWRREEPVGGGPVAAIAAGLAAVHADVVVVLAADQPDVAPAVPALRTALDGPADVTCLVDPDGRMNYLAAAWRTAALRAALAALGAPNGAPVRALMADRALITVPDAAGWGRDCDTWDELTAARRRMGDRSEFE